MTSEPSPDTTLDDFALADEFALAGAQAPALQPVLDAIDAGSGRIPFADFMAIALGHPEHGYYSRPDLRWGREGDYETSPEVHPIFGYLWARQVAECWERLGRPSLFALVEPGAGSGVFMTSMLTWLRSRRPDCFEAARPTVLDGSPLRLGQQRARLEAHGFDATYMLVEDWLAQTEKVTGIVISNEFFDALPIHLVERSGDAVHEFYVEQDEGGALTLVAGDLSTPAITTYFQRLGLQPGDGARAEVGLAAADAMRRIADRIERGYVLTIDYGYEARDLYASWRKQGTLMAFRRHSPQPDPLDQPGLTDLTYHVDFTSLARATGDGWATAPLVTQAEALTVLGLPDALRAAAGRAADNVQRYAEERRAAETLTDMSGLGRIRLLVMGKHATVEGLRCLQPLELLMHP